MNDALPRGWVQGKLQNIIGSNGLFSDGDWVESKDQDPAGQIRLVQLADIGDGKFLNKSSRFINDRAFERLNCTEILAGDVLVARMPDPLGRACVFPTLPQKCITVVDVAIVRPSVDTIDKRWLAHWINSPAVREEMQLLASGTTRQRISRRNLGEIEFPIPPFAEQKRIADKLDILLGRIDACRDRLDSMPRLLQRFTESVLDAATSGKLTEDWRRKGLGLKNDEDEPIASFEFLDAACFGEYAFPASWQPERFSNIADIIGGVTKDTKKQIATDPEVPYLRVANVQRGFLDLKEIKSIRIPENKLRDLLLESGDILLTEGGDLDKLGRGWIWSGEIAKCSFQNHIFRARLKDQNHQPEFFSWFANSRGYEYFLTYGKQTTNLASINKSIVQRLPVVVPPAQEQAEIVRRVRILLGFASEVRTRVDNLFTLTDKMKPSLLAKAFNGELLSQDPNDEPASALLERIREQQTKLEKQPRARKPRQPKETISVRKLIDVLAEAGDWIMADEAFRRCGIGDGSETEHIEELYAELRTLDKAGRLAVTPVTDSQGRKQHDRLKLLV
jgi:type I restriction enzyme, S subunit